MHDPLNTRKSSWSALLVTSAIATVGALTVLPAATTLHAQASWEVLATGLANPRGLAFDPTGALYVAEAGSGGAGPCITNSEGSNVCYGATGAITRVPLTGGAPPQRLLTGLPSLAPGPEAGDAAGTGAIGPVDVGFQGRGNGWAIIGFGANPALRADLGSVGATFGHLLRFQPNGRAELGADLAGYEAAADPDGVGPDSDPYGIAPLPSRTVYADAGGNALNQVAANGQVSTLAVFPEQLVPFAGGSIPMQSVPTTVVQGPDGNLYVGQLTGFPFPVGGASIFRVPSSGGAPEVVATGFTNIIDLAFGPDQSLYVLEIAANGLLNGPPVGALIRIAPNGDRTTIASGDAFAVPGGLAVGPDGALYVTLFATSPTGGEVVRIQP